MVFSYCHGIPPPFLLNLVLWNEIPRALRNFAWQHRFLQKWKTLASTHRAVDTVLEDFTCTTLHTSPTLVSPVEFSQHNRLQLPGYDNFMGLVQYAIVYCQFFPPWVILVERCWNRNRGFVRRPSLSHEFTQDRQRWFSCLCHSDLFYCTSERLRRIQFYRLSSSALNNSSLSSKQHWNTSSWGPKGVGLCKEALDRVVLTFLIPNREIEWLKLKHRTLQTLWSTTWGFLENSFQWLMVRVYYHILLATQCTCALCRLVHQSRSKIGIYKPFSEYSQGSYIDFGLVY